MKTIEINAFISSGSDYTAFSSSIACTVTEYSGDANFSNIHLYDEISYTGSFDTARCSHNIPHIPSVRFDMYDGKINVYTTSYDTTPNDDTYIDVFDTLHDQYNLLYSQSLA